MNYTIFPVELLLDLSVAHRVLALSPKEIHEQFTPSELYFVDSNTPIVEIYSPLTTISCQFHHCSTCCRSSLFFHNDAHLYLCVHYLNQLHGCQKSRQWNTSAYHIELLEGEEMGLVFLNN